MVKVSRLFKVGQAVRVLSDGQFHKGVVKQVSDNDMIVDVPDICDHVLYEQGWNLGNVYPEYNF